MRKVKSYKKHVIAQDNYGYFHIFTADEWSMGANYRTADWEAGSLAEAEEWIG